MGTFSELYLFGVLSYMANICRKCKSIFKTHIKIDGKKRNLCGRKFCLTCSPFGAHNTKPDDPARASVDKNKPYAQWPQKLKDQYLKRYYIRGVNRKKELVDSKGGRCQSCGYDKCLRCLTFHHREPNKKSFALTIRELSGMSMESILEEVGKCDLLCLNCHIELEANINPSKWSDLKMGEAGVEPAT